MQADYSERTRILIGNGRAGKLASSRVLVFGLGGVGGSCAEALVRAGVGRITAVDGDVFAASNINRQLLALRSTVGRLKAEVFRERARDISPETEIDILPVFYSAENSGAVCFGDYDYVVDCIDDAAAKVLIIKGAKAAEVPVISCMGAGGRSGLPDFTVADLFDTSGDPLARKMRSLLRKEGICSGVQCVISRSAPDEKPSDPPTAEPGPGKRIIGSISYVPQAAGLTAAAAVCVYLMNRE